MSKSEVFVYAAKMTQAITCLLHAQHYVPAVMLTYASIDHMAWLSVSVEKSTPQDFKDWVTKYIVSKNPIGCDAEELWAARNGLLHMGTAESAAHASGAVKNKIYYTIGQAVCTENISTDVLFVKVEDFVSSFLAGVLWFVSDLESDPTKLQETVEKLNRTLNFKGLN